jgi:hypothetical protein
MNIEADVTRLFGARNSADRLVTAKQQQQKTTRGCCFRDEAENFCGCTAGPGPAMCACGFCGECMHAWETEKKKKNQS